MIEKFENKVICGDSLEVLSEMPNDTIDLIITSPPYFNQRDYGNGANEIGNENTENQYLSNILAIFKECVRITKDTGLIVFNIGDKYINGGLQLIPFKFAISVLENENVFLVNNITWNKLNPTPRQDKKKLVQTTEPFFVFAKTKNYKFKMDDFLKHLDVINKNQKKATNGVGQSYFSLIDNSALTIDEKNNAKKS